MVKKRTHTTQPEIGIAACHFDLNGTVPSEIKLTPSGVFKAKDGRPHGLPGWRMNAINAQQAIAYAKAHSDDFVIDYEHQTLFTETNGQPAPAGGWFNDLQWREGDGLYAKVQWTEAAKAAIEAKEYRYISPVIVYDKKTGDVSGVQMAALVNYAAIDGLSDLTARAAAHFSFTNSVNNQTEDNPVNKELLALLGLDENASEEDISKAVAVLKAKADTADQLQTDVAALKVQSENPDPAKFVSIDVMNQSINGLKTDVAALSAQISGTEAEALISTALDDGRLLPAQKEWAEGMGKTNIAALKGFLDSAQPIDALKTTQTDGKEPIETKNEFGLTDTDIAMCKTMNLSQEDYAKANNIEVQQ